MEKFLLKQSLVLLSVLFASVTMISCSDDAELGSVDTRATQSITVSGVITGTNNWSGTVYLDGKVFLVNGTLNIAPGTTIIGKAKNTFELASALIITRTGKINADGTNGTIIFKGETDTEGAWGGLVLLGTAAINQQRAQTVTGIHSAQAGGNDITYGTPAHNKTEAQINALNNVSSGTLKYVRVENAGAVLSNGNELNAFTFGGVGSLTTVEHCQAYHGADDGFEFFGGAVNCKYLVSTANDDDAFDFDLGYTGKIQFAVATIDPSLTYSSDPSGIECDNDGSGSALTPFTHPVLSNLTIVGTSAGTTNAGIALRSAADFDRNCQFTLVNSVLYGYPRGILKERANTTYTLENNVVCAVPSTGINFSADKSATTTFTPSTTNSSLTSYDAIVLTSPFGNYYNSNALKPTGAPALTGASFTGLSSWFTTTTYKGAVAGSGSNWLLAAWIK